MLIHYVFLLLKVFNSYSAFDTAISALYLSRKRADSEPGEIFTMKRGWTDDHRCHSAEITDRLHIDICASKLVPTTWHLTKRNSLSNVVRLQRITACRIRRTAVSFSFYLLGDWFTFVDQFTVVNLSGRDAAGPTRTAVLPSCAVSVTPDAWAEKNERFERINSVRVQRTEILTRATHVDSWFPAVYMSCLSQNFRLLLVSNLSVRNLQIFLLMYPGSELSGVVTVRCAAVCVRRHGACSSGDRRRSKKDDSGHRLSSLDTIIGQVTVQTQGVDTPGSQARGLSCHPVGRYTCGQPSTIFFRTIDIDSSFFCLLPLYNCWHW